MAWRGGYGGEWKAKKELISIYGKESVIKIAIAQMGADFMVISKGRLVLLVEVKETIHNKYYPGSKEIRQIARIKEFAITNECKAELWIYYKRGSGQPTIKEVRELN